MHGDLLLSSHSIQLSNCSSLGKLKPVFGSLCWWLLWQTLQEFWQLNSVLTQATLSLRLQFKITPQSTALIRPSSKIHKPFSGHLISETLIDRSFRFDCFLNFCRRQENMIYKTKFMHTDLSRKRAFRTKRCLRLWAKTIVVRSYTATA